MGSCVSKKAARGGAGAKVAAPLPPVKDNALPPPALVVEEEVKEVLSETAVQRARPPEPEPEQEKKVMQRRIQEDEEAGEASDSVSCVCVAEKAMVKSGSEQEVEKRTVDAPEKENAERRKAPDQWNLSNGRARSPSPAPPNSQRRPQQERGTTRTTTVGEQPVAAPARSHPAVVSGIGCRSGRFSSPSAARARRAAESAVRRTSSAREADMALPANAKRSLNASVRRDLGERSGRRPPDSPSPSPARRTPAPASPAANGGNLSRQSSATRKVPKENTCPCPDQQQTKPQCGRGGRPHGHGEIGGLGDQLDEAPLKEAADGPLGKNPSVAMECFIFL